MTRRITLTLPEDVVAQARVLCEGNFSQFVTKVLREHLDGVRRQELRSALEEGYKAEAEHDLAVSEDFRIVDHEMTDRFTPGIGNA